LELINKNLSGDSKFNHEEFKSVVRELDPFNTGFVQLDQLLKFFKEEISHYEEGDRKKERGILDSLRSIAIPS